MKRLRLLMVYILLVVGMFSLGQWINDLKQDQADRLVIPTRAEIIIYTDGNPELMTAIGQAYEKEAQVKVHVIPIPPNQMGIRLALPEGEQQGDIVISTKLNLGEGVEHGAFRRLPVSLTSKVDTAFHGPDEQWIGIWYDPYVFALHNDFYSHQGKYVNTWFSLAYTGPWRVTMTDFVADEASITLLNTFGAIYGLDGAISYFDSLRPRIVQHAKALPSAVRMSAIGDVQVSVGHYSDAKLYEVHKYPVTILYPREGTPYDMMGVGILKGSSNVGESEAFVSWLLSERVQAVLKIEDTYYLPTIETVKSQKDRQGNHLFLWNVGIVKEEQDKILQEWIRQVRFRKDTP
ncbi:ABC transporter substrate-binding protein [Veillonella sp. VA142]|uniref:ABC transporter substrate-binding protein n=1 Tax=Veillonella sp. VA142 TaxID=741834 RepID=UPI000F8EC9B0|nr:extracellular solute-binding protein [Veillonella sp. VA142]